MAPSRQVTDRQMEIMVEFAEDNRDIALNNKSGPFSSRETARAWEEFARRMNSVPGGVKKHTQKWKRYWNILKCRTRSKAADYRRNGASSNGDGSKLIPLSHLELRIVDVLLGETVKRTKHDEPAQTQQNTTARNRTLDTIEDPLELIKGVVMKNEFISTISEANTREQNSDSDDMEAPLLTTASQPTTAPRHVPSETKNSCYQYPFPKQSHRSDEEDNVPSWLYSLEERRIASEERLANAVVGMAATNKSILGCLERMAESQAQLVDLLRQYQTTEHINSRNE